MKKSFLRAAVIACLPFCAMGLAVVTTPAYAADKEKAEAPKISKSISKLITDAKKAIDAKDYPTVIAKCDEALKVTDLTDYDRYIINRFQGVAYFGLNDRVKAGAAFAAVVKNPGTPAEDRDNLVGPAMSLAAETNNNALVIELGKTAVEAKSTNPDVYGTLANAYYQANDNANAITYAQKGVDMANSQNKIPQYALYQILAFSYDKQKDRANEVKVFEAMARDYGKPDDWRYLLDFSLELLPAGPKQSREIAALDIYRLRLLTDAAWAAQNFLEAEDAAHSIRSWGDSRTFLQLGVSKGVINQGKIAPLMAQINADAKKDEPILATVEKSAKNSKDIANVAEAYYGYGRYADAARAGQAAANAGGAGAGEGKLVVLMSQVRQGNEEAAKQTAASFQGDAVLNRVVQLWSVYLNRKYGKPGATPAPAAQ